MIFEFLQFLLRFWESFRFVYGLRAAFQICWPLKPTRKEGCTVHTDSQLPVSMSRFKFNCFSSLHSLRLYKRIQCNMKGL